MSSRRAGGGLVWMHITLVVVLAGALALIPIIDPRSLNLQRIAFFFLWYATLASAWNIVGGFVGQISFGHSAFLGIGAYVSGILWSTRNIDPLVTLPIAALVAAAYAVVVGAPTLRLRGPYFAIATIGIGEATRLFFVNFDDIFGVTLTRGVTGISLPTYDPVVVHFAASAVFGVTMIASILIRSGRFGLGLFAINMEADAAETVGVPTARLQVLAFAASAALAALAGTLYAARQQFLDPATMFGFDESIAMVLMPVLGGLGTIWGPVLGALLYSVVQDQITSLVNNPYLPALIYGIVLVLIVLFEPTGLAGLFGRASSSARSLVRRRVSARGAE